MAPSATHPPMPQRDAPTPYDSSPSAQSSSALDRKPTAAFAQQSSIPSFSIDEHNDTVAGGRDSTHSVSSLAPSSTGHSRTPSRETPDIKTNRDSGNSTAVAGEIPFHQLHISDGSYGSRYSHAADMDVANLHAETDHIYSPGEQQLQSSYFSQEPTPPPATYTAHDAVRPSSIGYFPSDVNGSEYGAGGPLQVPRTTLPRPSSAYVLGSEPHTQGRAHTPHLAVGGGLPSPGGSPSGYARQVSGSRRSPDIRPMSYVDLLNLPYNQQIAPSASIGNAQLRTAVGQNASLLDTKKTLDMYRGNLKKTQDSAVQYEFAIFMVQVAREVMASGPSTDDHGLAPTEMLREARQILQRLADRSYPFAQYYLADGYASGLFNKDKPDYDRAFPLFVAASKHGHAESGYRTALCYEFGWGCRKDYAKAVQFFRAAASKNHPGAATRLGKACLTGDMGLQGKYREGVKWLKRATESADHQYNNAPYELGLLHETGYGDDIFKDEIYAVQLFTQAAELGHSLAAMKLGEAYEHGHLRCPKDAALSVHFYNCAAQADIPEAMMNLCAWYMVGAEPVLEKDENEAYEWAKRAADHGKIYRTFFLLTASCANRVRFSKG